MTSSKKPRGPGRPRNSERVITEDMYPEIHRRVTRFESIRSLAVEYDVSYATMQQHVQRAKAQVRAEMVRSQEELEGAVIEVIRTSWEDYVKSRRTLTHDEVQRELDTVASQAKSPDQLVYRITRQVTRISTRDGNPAFLAIVLQGLDMLAKLRGAYEVGKREGQAPLRKSAYRVAGHSPAEVRKLMRERLAKLLEFRRATPNLN